MAIRHWLTGQSGAWTQASAWSGDSVPRAGDDAVLAAKPGAGRTGYTVLLATAARVGSVTQTQPGATLNVAGGTLSLGGTYGLAAGTLALEGGRLTGGTLVMEGGTLLAGPGALPGDPLTNTLSALTVQGPLLLTSQYADIQVTDGLTLAGSSGAPGTLGIEGDGDTLSFGGLQALDHLSIGIGDPSPSYVGDALFADGPGGRTSTLTLGAHSSVVQTGSVAELAGAGQRGLVINDGRISACSVGGTFTMRSLHNRGLIAVSPGGEALLAGISNAGTISDMSGLVSVQGSLLNTGLISIAGAGGRYLADPYGIPGLVNDGVFSVSAGATASLGLYGYGWTNAGTLAVAGGLLSVGGNFTTAELGRVDISCGGTLGLTGTLANTGSLAVGAGSALSALAVEGGGEIAGGVVGDAGGGLVAQGGTLAGVTYFGALQLSAAGARLTITGGLTLTDSTGALPGTLAVTAPGASLVWDSVQALDRAILSIGAPAGSGAPPSILAAPGGPVVQLGGQLRIQHSGAEARIGGTDGDFSSAATLTANLAGGQFTLGGAQFTNAGTIGISHGDTVVAASANFTNAGLIVLGVGTLALDLADYIASGQTAAESFANSGRIQMAGGTLAELTDGGAFPKIPLLNAARGSIEGAGVIASQIDNDGVIEARGGVLNLVQTVSGQGMMRIDSGAMLALGGVGAGQTVAFGGAGGVLGLQPAAFLGTIAGFAPGDTIDLFGTEAVSASFHGDELDVVLGNGATLGLVTTAPLSGALVVTPGLHGDSLIRFAPADSVMWTAPEHTQLANGSA